MKGTSADRNISTGQNDTFVFNETIPIENEKEKHIPDHCLPGENSGKKDNEIFFYVSFLTQLTFFLLTLIS